MFSDRPSENCKQEYIVTQGGRGNPPTLASVLHKYSGVDVLANLDRWTALVSMPRITSQKINKEHPELVIEPNLSYSHAG